MIDLFIMRIPSVMQSTPLAHAPHLAAHLGGHNARFLMVYKAEANRCGKGYETPLEWTVGADYRNASCALVLRQALAAAPIGPFRDDARAAGAFFPFAISRPCIEGPSVLRAPDGSWILLFDAYRTDCTLLAPASASGRCELVGGHAPAVANLRSTGRSTAADGGEQVIADGGDVPGKAANGPANGVAGRKSDAPADREYIADGVAGGDAGRDVLGTADVFTEGTAGGAHEYRPQMCGYQTARRGFGALVSTDLATWNDVSGSVNAPDDYKHGTALLLPAAARRSMCRHAGGARGLFEPFCQHDASFSVNV